MHKLGLTAAVAAVAGFGLVGPGQADNDFRNKYQDGEVSHACGDDSTVTYHGPEKLWPPNHKLQDVAVTVTDESGDDVTLTVVHNVEETLSGPGQGSGSGGPQHDPDVFFPEGPGATGSESATVPVQLRSERSGRSAEGRTYVLDWTATADNGLTQCASTDETDFEILVPHDMRGGADWK